MVGSFLNVVIYRLPMMLKKEWKYDCITFLSDLSLEETVNGFSGKNFSEFKESLSQVVVDKIIPISVEIKKLLNEKDYLDKILKDGCNKANDIASKKIKKIHEIVGF